MGRSQRPARPIGRRAISRIAMVPVLLGAWVAAAHALDPQGPVTKAAANRERNDASRRWFQDAKLGMFVHWGIYSLLAKGEWVMDNDKLPIEQYAKLPPRFNPSRFDAQAWVQLAKSAGARYITVTAKHYDGFCMFASDLTTYDLVDATPYRSDPLKSLADACRKQKIKLFFYYSLLDWHHPDYFPLGKTGRFADRAKGGDWKRYVAYYQGQVRELCTRYGEIGGIWFDGWWDRPDADWDLAATYKMIHELQPDALIGNNHHVEPFPGEDFQIFEQDVPGENRAGFNLAAVARGLPRETCLTINDSWGYSVRDTKYKSVEQIIHALVAAAGRGSNLLLNVGPRPDGEIEPEARKRLQELGKWLGSYGDSVYGTRAGPFPPQDWGVSTMTGAAENRKIYLHVTTQEEIALRLRRASPDAPVSVDPTILWIPCLFGTTNPLKSRQTDRGFVLDLPVTSRTAYDTIVVLTPKPVGR
jgi:alpha-L-fucosidase